MVKISVKKLSELSHIDLTEDQESQLQAQLESILNFVDEIQKLDLTSGSELTDPYNVMRDDKVHEFEDIDSLKSQFPEKDGDFMKITRVIKGS